uniref:Uncharacterized protein n=1 Tax=Opuntia streptacantha TaxID=393608 RepID=A0A7C9CVA0_OPUST
MNTSIAILSQSSRCAALLVTKQSRETRNFCQLSNHNMWVRVCFFVQVDFSIFVNDVHSKLTQQSNRWAKRLRNSYLCKFRADDWIHHNIGARRTIFFLWYMLELSMDEIGGV